MSADVSNIERVGLGMILVDSYDCGDVYDRQLWASTKARKPATCMLSDERIRPGDEIYRPVGNARNRSRRMLVSAVDKNYPQKV